MPWLTFGMGPQRKLGIVKVHAALISPCLLNSFSGSSTMGSRKGSTSGKRNTCHGLPLEIALGNVVPYDSGPLVAGKSSDTSFGARAHVVPQHFHIRHQTL